MKKFQGYLALFLIGLGIRLAAFTINMPFVVDVNTFQAWAGLLFNEGLSNFYSSDAFTDYPPMYMYVLWVVGAIRHALNLGHLSTGFNLLIFTPAIIFDLIAGLLIYRLCRHTLEDDKSFGKSFWISFAYLANPAIIINSSVWGQVDSIHTLLLFLSLFAVSKKQSLPAYLLYGVAVLTKPQSLIVAPIFLYSAFYYWKERDYSLKAAATMLGYAAATFGFMILLSLPFTPNFDLSPVIRQYADTLGSTPVVALNAYNFHTLMGANWEPIVPFSFHSLVGVTAIVGITCMTFFILHRKWSEGNIFFAAALLFITTFTFSIRMNERYLFPALLFLLSAAILSEIKLDKKLLILYGIFSVTLFINCADVLLMSHGTRIFTIGEPPPLTFRPLDGTKSLISFINVAMAVYSLKIGWDIIRTGEYSHLRKIFREVAPPVILIVIYSTIAFYNLGNTQSPQTAWTEEYGAGGDFGEVRHISRFQYMLGARFDVPFMLFTSLDGVDWDFSLKVEGNSVFAWGEEHIGVDAKYFQLVPFGPGVRIQEVAFRDQWDNLIHPYTIFTGHVMFDEQHLVPQRRGFLNSFYFDEIFHARAGYEFLHGLPVLEDSHPPMGKNFIAMSINAFGMTPFAWRLPGTLAGIFMIILMYIFGRMMFQSNFWGMFAASIFAFDFMTFVQTRIATIDSYIVLFVIASYLCMYAYIRYSDTSSLRRNLLYLLGSGVFIGLAIASKWQGVYAALGLPLIFFPVLYKLYKQNPKEAKITFYCCFAFFVAIPVTIYLLSYIPFVRAMDTEGDGFLTTVIDNQIWMFSYHAGLEEGHPFSSRWWEWPLIIRPMFYYNNTVSDTVRQGISSFGNPAVWWTGILATAAAFAVLRDKDKTEHRQTVIFLLIAYAAQYVPWMFVFRSTFIYHYFPSVPFVVLLITFCFKTYVAPKYPKMVWAYGAVVVGLFMLFYPVLSGAPVSMDFVRTFLRWFPGWVLVA